MSDGSEVGLAATVRDAALWLTFAREKTLNALTVPLLQAAAAQLEKAAADETVRAVVRGRAARMAMLADRGSAPPALDWGLLSHLVDDDAFGREVAALVDRLAEGPTRAYAQTKAALNASTLGLLEQAHTREQAGQ